MMVPVLFSAAILGDVEAVSAQLMSAGGDADQLFQGTNVRGETIMHVAATHGHTNLVRDLAHRNPMAPFATDLHGRTPLHLAALYGKAEVVVELLKLSNVDPNCKDHNLQTPLFLAALRGHMPAMRELLKGPKPQQELQLTAIDRHGDTVLHLAVRRAHVDTVRFLLKSSAAKQVMYQVDQSGWTVVHLAAGLGRADIIEEYFKIRWDSDILKQVNGTRWSPLHVASWFGHVEIVKWMCEKMGFCVNTTAKSLERLTSLHMAAHNGHDAVVKYLLSYHAELEIGYCDALGRTALHYAARQGHTAVVRKLLEFYKPKASGRALSVDATDVNGLTALHLAAREGHEQIVQILIEGGADVNAKSKSSSMSKSLLDHVLSSGSPHESILDPIILETDCWGISQMTPLHFAARNGHLGVVRQLLKHPEVNVRALDGHGLTPQDWAEVRKVRKEIFVCLEQVSRSAGQLHIARASKKKLQILREEMMKWEKRVIVMPPSTFHSLQSMQYMAEAACEGLDHVGGASGIQDGRAYSDPHPSINSHGKEVSDTRGMNLDSRSYGEDINTTARVLQEICESTAQDELSGNTPLHVAVKRGHKKAVEFLVKCGQKDDVNGENSDGDTPLALAFEKNDVEICRLLLQNSEKLDDDLCEMLQKAMARNWLDMGVLLLGDARIRTSGSGCVSVDLLDEATHSEEKKFLDLMLRRTTIKERLLQERKEHLDSAGAMLVIAAFIASITYEGNLQPPQGEQQYWVHALFDGLNAIAFYTAVAATIAVASGALPVRHMYELIDARDPMRISSVISCVLLAISSACVVWAYAAAGICRASDRSKLVLPIGNGVGALVTTLFLFWFLKEYIQLYKPFCHRSYGRISDQNNEGCICILGRRVTQVVEKMRTIFSKQGSDGLQDNLLSRNAEMSTAVA